MIALGVLTVMLVAAVAVGLLLRRNEGRVRERAAAPRHEPESTRATLLAAAGVVPGRPTVLHFSADWCGPCVAVRRVVAGVVAELAAAELPPLDLEVDIDEFAELARELNVLSLPTTFGLDSRGLERFRISGVPKAADLRTSMASLTIAAADE
ncbi:thioredoxin family protein [Nocardia sp. NPDC004151]|uniref:thioredoxin family protein n=1 Tax=Nocardia sp. NPDC004151 TaxID=3364304 RepID=UPI0036811E5B